MTDYQWHVLGPGAIGSLFACHLQKAQLSTALVTRSPSEDARLITLEHNGQSETHAFQIDNSERPFKNLLVTVKAHQTAQALLSNKSRIHHNTLVVLLQNGMGAWQTLQTEFPNTPFLVASTTEGAYRSLEHHIVHAGRGCTWVGSLTEQWRSKIAPLLQQWNPLELKLLPDINIEARLWQKLAINCAINPLTVIYDCKNGDLLKNSKALEEMKSICDEAELVLLKALGNPLPEPLFTVAKKIAQSTGRNKSSMLQDYHRGNATEIDFITGYLVSAADKLGIKVNTNRRVLETIKAISF